MPAVPFSESHHVIIQLFVQIVQKTDGLNDHSVDFFDGELKFESRKTMRKSKGHAF